MKILLITHILPWPPRGGCAQRNYNLIRQAAKEHQLDLVTFYRREHLRHGETLDGGIAAMKRLCREVHVYPVNGDGNRLSYYWTLLKNLFSSDPYSAALYHSPEMIAKVNELLAANDYDVIEIGEIGLLNYADLAPGIPKVLIHHNVESQLLYRRAEVASNGVMKNYIKLQAYRTARFEQKGGRTIERHTTCSEVDKKTLERIAPGIKAVVVPNGVDTELFVNTGEPVVPNSLVFVGGLRWLPNRHAMISFAREVWPILKERIPDIKITVGGGGPPEELVELSKKDPNFVVPGFVDDVNSVISQAAVYVVPISVGGGTRLKILDAMSLSKAIVSHPIGAEGIQVQDGENLILASTAEQMADTIVELLQNEELRSKLEQNARRTAEQVYDWGVIAPKLLNIYEELAETGRETKIG